MLIRLSLLLLPLVLGCSPNPTPAELELIYRTGMSRQEAATAFGEPMLVQNRPATGWREQEQTAERIGAFAARFEREHSTSVQTCEVYWVGRGILGMGVWWDYLFYGRDDRMLGFHRRFVD